MNTIHVLFLHFLIMSQRLEPSSLPKGNVGRHKSGMHEVAVC
jgi:hypothetical protein